VDFFQDILEKVYESSTRKYQTNGIRKRTIFIRLDAHQFMIKSDPIIAVKNVSESSLWYQKLLGCSSLHGGDEFDILADNNNQVILNLHKWGNHEHPTMIDDSIEPGNGLILYLRTNRFSVIHENAQKLSCKIEEELHINPNTGHQEFSLRDPDGYYLTISAFHKYGG